MQELINQKRKIQPMGDEEVDNRSWVVELQKIQNHLGVMKQMQDHKGLNLENLLDQVDPSFIDKIMQEEVPLKFKLPLMKAYNSSKD